MESPISTEDPKLIFDLLQQIGAGSYGTVHQAFNLETSEIVAVKIIPLNADEPPNQILKEVNLMRTISADLHPNLVNFLDAYRDENDIWIVMEYCSAGALTDLMRDQQRVLSEQEASFVMKNALLALKFLHEKKILHRDVKANNLLVSDEGCIKLADFGVSFQLQQTCEKRKSVIGTPYWMAPEVLKGELYGYQSDIWALGVTLAEILEGKPPLAGVHPMRAMMLIPQQEPYSLRGKKSQFGSEFSNGVCSFLEKMLVKDPEKRATIDELLEDEFLLKFKDLGDLINGEGGYGQQVDQEEEKEQEGQKETDVDYDQATVVQAKEEETQNYNTVVQSVVLQSEEDFTTIVRNDQGMAGSVVQVELQEPEKVEQQAESQEKICPQMQQEPEKPIEQEKKSARGKKNKKEQCKGQ